MVGFSTVMQVLPAIAMLALAMFMLFKQPKGLKSRTFGVLMFLFAGRIILHRIVPLVDDFQSKAHLMHVADAYILALPAALLAFVLATILRRPRWVILPPLGLAVVLAFIHLANPALFVLYVPATNPHWEYDIARGPLAFLVIAWPVYIAMAGLWLAMDAYKNPEDPCSQAGALVSVGFLLNAVVDGTIMNLSPILYGWSYTAGLIGHVAAVAQLTLIPIIGLHLGYLFAYLGDSPRRITHMKHLAGASIIAAAIGSSVHVASIHDFSSTFVAFMRILIPSLMAFALLRHRLFGIDVKVRWTISKTTIGAVFVTVGFSVSELATILFSDAAGNEYYGVIAAAMLVFFWVPLQNLAERFAHTLLPEQNFRTHNEKEIMYLRQAKLVWADGTMGKKERQILDLLQEDLGIDKARAATIEHEAFVSHGVERKNLSGSVA